jgi:hypothetical protein
MQAHKVLFNKESVLKKILSGLMLSALLIVGMLPAQAAGPELGTAQALNDIFGAGSGYSNLVITAPASGFTVTVNPVVGTQGAVYISSSVNVKGATRTVLQQGLISTPQSITVADPATLNQIYLIECGNLFGATFVDPTNNASCKSVAGVVASSPLVPSTDVGYFGIGYVTLANNTANVTSGLITMYPYIGVAPGRLNQSAALSYTRILTMVSGVATWTFTTPYLNAPICTAVENGATVETINISAVSTTAVSVKSSNAASTATVNVICVGNPN